jgi:predicted transcriptional regulator
MEMKPPTRLAFAAASAYVRRAMSDSADYQPAKASRIYERFGLMIEAVAQYQFEQRSAARTRELSEWLRSQYDGGSSDEPPVAANSVDINR